MECEADHRFSKLEVHSEWSFTATLPYVIIHEMRGNGRVGGIGENRIHTVFWYKIIKELGKIVPVLN
jgi:hypothetical protein